MIDQNTQPLDNTSTIQQNLSSSPTSVIIPQNDPGVPKWFYFIFGLTVIVFFFVTTLIILQLIKREPGPEVAQPVSVSVTPSTGMLPTPTLTVMVATDSAITKLNEVGSSDEISSIEADLKATDLTVLDQSLMIVDNQTGSY